MSDEKGATFAISGIKDRVLVYGFIILVGGSSAFNLAIPKRPDPFTGADGDLLKSWISDNEDRIEMLELDVSACKSRNSEHREFQASDVAKLKADVENNKYLITQCMHTAGQ